MKWLNWIMWPFNWLLWQLFGPGSASWRMMKHLQHPTPDKYALKEFPADHECDDIDNRDKWRKRYEKMRTENELTRYRRRGDL